jgi:hypothetical protein
MMNSVCTMFYPQHLELEQLESSLMMSIFYLLYIKQDNYQKDFIFFSQSKGHIHQEYWMHIHVSHQIKNKFPSD